MRLFDDDDDDDDDCYYYPGHDLPVAVVTAIDGYLVVGMEIHPYFGTGVVEENDEGTEKSMAEGTPQCHRRPRKN